MNNYKKKYLKYKKKYLQAKNIYGGMDPGYEWNHEGSYYPQQSQQSYYPQQPYYSQQSQQLYYPQQPQQPYYSQQPQQPQQPYYFQQPQQPQSTVIQELSKALEIVEPTKNVKKSASDPKDKIDTEKLEKNIETLKNKIDNCESQKLELIKLAAIHNLDLEKKHRINHESLLPYTSLGKENFFPNVGPFIFNMKTNLIEDELNEFKNYDLDKNNLDKKPAIGQTLSAKQIMFKNFIGFLNSNKGGRLFFGITDSGRTNGIPNFNTNDIDALQIKIQQDIFNKIIAYNTDTNSKSGFVDPNKINFVWHWVYNYDSPKNKIESDESSFRVPMLPHRWILEIQVMPAKSNFIYMDSDENIWFRISGATIKKNLLEAKLILSQREKILDEDSDKKA